jgi:hypothetical protein
MTDTHMAAGSDHGPAARSFEPLTAATIRASKLWPTPAYDERTLAQLRAAPAEVRLILYRSRHLIDPIKPDGRRVHYCGVDGIRLEVSPHKLWHAIYEVRELEWAAPVPWPSEVRRKIKVVR